MMMNIDGDECVREKDVLRIRLQTRWMALWCGILLSWPIPGRAENLWLTMPKPGANQLRLLSPVLLELTLITTKQTDPDRLEQWDFVDAGGHLQAPAPQEFVVTLNDRPVPVQSVGF